MGNCIIKKFDAVLNNDNLPVLRDSITIKECAMNLFELYSPDGGASWVNGLFTPTDYNDYNPNRNRIKAVAWSSVVGKKIMIVAKPLDLGFAQIMKYTAAGISQDYIWQGSCERRTIMHALWEPTSGTTGIAFTTAYPRAINIEIYMYDVTNLTAEQIAENDWNDPRFAVYNTETYIYV